MKKLMVITSILSIIVLSFTMATVSYAWYSTISKADKSLDYVVTSTRVITIAEIGTPGDTRVIPAKASKGAVASGQDVSNVFGSSAENIAEKATLGVSNIPIQYYSGAGAGVMQIYCSVSASRPDGTIVTDIDDEVGYLVCVTGLNTIDPRWIVQHLPANATCWYDNDGEYEEYVLPPSSVYFTITTNATHAELNTYFGVNDYATVCVYDASTSTYSDWWSREDANYTNDEAFKTAFTTALGEGTHDFTYNSLPFVWEADQNNVTVYSNQPVGQIETNSDMTLNFLVFVWFRRVDELLDPALAGSTLRLSFVVDTGDD